MLEGSWPEKPAQGEDPPRRRSRVPIFIKPGAFSKLLDPDAERFTFQTFDDTELKRGHLWLRCWYGTSGQVGAATRGTTRGPAAGVFVTVNETDLAGALAQRNICRVRGVFVDLDGFAARGPSLACDLDPHLIVTESRPASSTPIGWSRICRSSNSKRRGQKTIAARFGWRPAS